MPGKDWVLPVGVWSNTTNNETTMNVRVILCPCGHPSCKTYQLTEGIFYQGNGFDKDTAEYLARCLNNREIVESALKGAGK